MIGNDIVDLDDAAIAEHHLRPRFVARVLSESERVRLDASREPKQLLWTFFAAKEAAFKVVEKLRGPTVFAHRRFVVGADLCSVHYEDVVLRLEVARGAGHVHAVAFDTDCARFAGAEVLLEGGDPSQAARDLLRRYASRWYGCRFVDVEVVRDSTPRSWTGKGPPRLLVRGVSSPCDVSLSHDGRFIAFALDAGSSLTPGGV